MIPTCNAWLLLHGTIMDAMPQILCIFPIQIWPLLKTTCAILLQEEHGHYFWIRHYNWEKGVVIATAHFGNWDLAGALVGRHYPLSGVTETFSDPRLNTLLQNQRRDKGISVIPLESSARRILRVLQKNEAVALVADRPLSPQEGTPIRFFGRTTYVPSGPATMAVMSGASIVPGYVWYGHHRQFYVRCFDPITPRPYKGPVEREKEVSRLTQYTYDALEVMIREWPSQWYMFRPFWPQGDSVIMYTLFLLAIKIIPWLPAWLIELIGRIAGLSAWFIATKAREQATWNMLHVLGPQVLDTPMGRKKLRRTVQAMFYNNVLNYLTMFSLSSQKPARIMRELHIEGREHFDAAFAVGKVLSSLQPYRAFQLSFPMGLALRLRSHSSRGTLKDPRMLESDYKPT